MQNSLFDMAYSFKTYKQLHDMDENRLAKCWVGGDSWHNTNYCEQVLYAAHYIVLTSELTVPPQHVC